MECFDIYRAKFTWRGETKPRPWLLVREAPFNAWKCFAISSADYDSQPFELDERDPDFPATGLDHTSYIYDADPLHELPPEVFMKRLGCLSGELLKKFRESSGV
jgi:hypothetical protein